MAPSSVSMSMSAFLMSRWIIRNVLEPLRQTSADLISAKETRLLIHDIVLAYCSPFLINNNNNNDDDDDDDDDDNNNNNDNKKNLIVIALRHNL